MTVGSEKAEFLKCSMASKNTITTPAARKRQKPEECDDDDLPDTSHYTQYFVMDPAEGHSLQKLSPFAIEKSMLCQVGTVRELKKLRSGTLLVRVASKGQAAAIVNLTQFAMVPVTVTAHKTLNTCRGVIRCRELRDCDDEEVMAELKAHGVISVHHVQATRSEKKSQQTHSSLLLMLQLFHNVSKLATCLLLSNSTYQILFVALNANDMDILKLPASALLTVLDVVLRATTMRLVRQLITVFIAVATMPLIRGIARNGKHRRALLILNTNKTSRSVRRRSS